MGGYLPLPSEGDRETSITHTLECLIKISITAVADGYILKYINQCKGHPSI